MDGCWNPYARLPGNGPTSGTHDTDSHDTETVLDPLVRPVALLDKTRQRTRPPPSAECRTPPPVAPRKPHIAAVPPPKQGLLNAVLAAGGRLARLARVLDVVVETLADEDEVGEAEVDGEGDDSGDEACPERTNEVGDVANEPDGEEGEGDAVCRALLVVFYELGHLRELAGRALCLHGSAVLMLNMSPAVPRSKTGRLEWFEMADCYRWMRDQLTSRNIHDASEMEPKTPDRASCVVSGRPWAAMVCRAISGTHYNAARRGRVDW